MKLLTLISTGEVRDVAIGGVASTLPLWVQYLNQVAAEIATIGGAAIVLVRLYGWGKTWLHKRKLKRGTEL